MINKKMLISLYKINSTIYFIGAIITLLIYYFGFKIKNFETFITAFVLLNLSYTFLIIVMLLEQRRFTK